MTGAVLRDHIVVVDPATGATTTLAGATIFGMARLERMAPSYLRPSDLPATAVMAMPVFDG